MRLGCGLDAEDLRLLGLELVVGDDALLPGLVELLQFLHVVGLSGGGRCRRLLGLRRSLLLHRLLLLVAGDLAGYGCRGACDDGGRGGGA